MIGLELVRTIRAFRSLVLVIPRKKAEQYYRRWVLTLYGVILAFWGGVLLIVLLER